MHKRLGTNDDQRTLLLHDYSESLRDFSDFTVYLACRTFREVTENPFYPQVAVLKNICVEIKNQLMAKAFPQLMAPEKKPRFDEIYYSKPQENPIRRTLCDHITGKGGEDYFNDNSYSNYQLERLAVSNYGYKLPDA